MDACISYLMLNLCTILPDALGHIPASCMIKLLQEETLYAPRGEYDRYVVVRQWLSRNPMYALAAGDARDRALEIAHVRGKLIGSIQFGSINSAHTLQIEKDCLEADCPIDLPEMRMYDQRDEYTLTVLSQFRNPWVDPGRRALTALSVKKSFYEARNLSIFIQ